VQGQFFNADSPKQMRNIVENNTLAGLTVSDSAVFYLSVSNGNNIPQRSYCVETLTLFISEPNAVEQKNNETGANCSGVRLAFAVSPVVALGKKNLKISRDSNTTRRA
jgi:hypothetical protein